MLDGLDQVDWEHLAHAYGPATDVPDLLRALVEPDGAPAALRAAATKANWSVRDYVIWALWGNVFHQGTVWQVSSHVVPLLAEIVQDGPVEVRAFAIDYMHHLAIGYPEDLFPRLVDPAAYFDAADQPDDDAANPYSEVKMAGYARACFRAVEAALPVIAPHARDPSDIVAEAAIATLASFRDGAPALWQVVATASGRRQALALVGLAQFDPARTQEFARRLLGAPNREVALLAAVALVLAGADDSEAISALTAPPDDLIEADCPLAGTVGTLVARTLERVGDDRARGVVEAIAATLPRAGVMTNLAATGSLLRLVFPGGTAPDRAQDLTAPQRAALEAIATHGAFRWGDGEFGNYNLLLGSYGLPRKAEALRIYLARR
jgi:hypothetical protein